MTQEVVERFLRYVRIDTQSKEEVEDAYPSTQKQFDLLRLLMEELAGIGLEEVEIDDYGYVTATLPSNLPPRKKAPVIGFLAHVDTSPEAPGKGVNPVVHENYQGGDIIINKEKGLVLTPDENPVLKDNIGNDIITTDGTTLLGADDKAGVAEIMTALHYLSEHPEIPHGKIRIGFTPDEEVGNGTKYFDVKRFGADLAYTIDGGRLGEVENENFNAAMATFKLKGYNVHPGYAKDKMKNSMRALGDLITRLPRDMAPETTEKREGYLHPHHCNGGVDYSELKVLIRDFEEQGLKEKKVLLQKMVDEVSDLNPGVKLELEIKDSYQNMRFQIDKNPRVVEYALKAVRMAGIEPKLNIIRGGTDGARLSYMGLPTPNIFTGGRNFHSVKEWIPVQAMEKAVEVIVNIAKLFGELDYPYMNRSTSTFSPFG
ncbi:MAG: peptidase T [Thermoplasmata archaeon]|nr:peptidase T [Thermoplasmata archaeon]